MQNIWPKTVGYSKASNKCRQKTHTTESMPGDEQIISALEQFEKSFALQSEQNAPGESKGDESNKNCKRVIELTL